MLFIYIECGIIGKYAVLVRIFLCTTYLSQMCLWLFWWSWRFFDIN